MSFSQGVSGLTAASAQLDVIGNNIANAGTKGYKAGQAEFASVYAGSQAGLGTKVTGIFQDFTAGAVQTSTNPLDIAIVDGKGFFRMTNPGGEISYTRNGEFNVDKDGYVVNTSNLRLTGFAVDPFGSLTGASPVALRIPTAAMTPQPTTTIDAQYNLDSRDIVPTKTFSPTDSTTFNFSNSVSIYDSLGNKHEMSNYFVKTGPNAWDVYSTADGIPVNAGGTGLSAITSAAGVLPVTYAPGGKVGTVSFDSTGKLVVSGTPSVGDKLTFSALDLGNGAAPTGFTMNLTGTTQFAADNEVRLMEPNGFSSGSLSSLSVGEDGMLTGKYSNQQTKIIGQIVLTTFSNVNGLQDKGNNVWVETPASGAPLTGTPGSGKTMGRLMGGATEASNVDMTAELINLIMAQRTYQANAQTVKTQDQVVQALINLR